MDHKISKNIHFSMPTQNIIDYYSEVLGINQVYIDTNKFHDDKPHLSTAPHSPQIFVFIENLTELNNQDLELLENMLAATKINRSCYQIFDLSQKEVKKEFIKSNDLQFELVKNPVDENQSYSPEVLHTQKSLKQETWHFLKKMMAQFESHHMKVPSHESPIA